MLNIKKGLIDFLFKLDLLSNIPGRLRLKVRNYKKLPKKAINYQEYAIKAIKKLDGVTKVTFNIVLGTVLIEYDKEKINYEDILEWIDTIRNIATDNLSVINKLNIRDENKVIEKLFSILDKHHRK